MLATMSDAFATRAFMNNQDICAQPQFKKSNSLEFDDASTSAGDEFAALEEVASQASLRQKAPHTLVWCHERCHKRESTDGRTVLAKAAPLVCLKKANKFASWCQRAEGYPYILLTDWREVKPCLAFLSTTRPTRRPSMTIILCDDPDAKIFSRAIAWVRSLGPEGEKVQVCRDLEAVLALLASASALPRAASPGSSPGSSRLSSKASSVSSISEAPQDLPPPETRCQPAYMAKRPPPLLITGSSVRSSARSDLFTASNRPSHPYEAVTSAWLQKALAPFGAMSKSELEELLYAAAPTDYYE